MLVAARNVSANMRAIIAIAGPRSLQGLHSLMQSAWTHADRLMSALDRLVATHGSRAPGRLTVKQSEARKATWARAC